jgi:hypothetical protein
MIPMFRFPIRDVLWLMVVVVTGSVLGGSFNAAVASDPVETVYQWMRGIVVGGLLAAILAWTCRAFWPANATLR